MQIQSKAFLPLKDLLVSTFITLYTSRRHYLVPISSLRFSNRASIPWFLSREDQFNTLVGHPSCSILSTYLNQISDVFYNFLVIDAVISISCHIFSVVILNIRVYCGQLLLYSSSKILIFARILFIIDHDSRPFSNIWLSVFL